MPQREVLRVMGQMFRRLTGRPHIQSAFSSAGMDGQDQACALLPERAFQFQNRADSPDHLMGLNGLKM